MPSEPFTQSSEAGTVIDLPGTSASSQIICGDNREVLRQLPDQHFDLCITSPPYWQQRDYGGTGIGNETTVDAYLDNIVETFGLLIRVMKPSGSIVYNLGDKYVDGNLMLIPYRFALQVTDELGLHLVNDVTWIKQNPAPHQYTRRLTSSTEPFFHFVLGKRYYYDRDAFAPTNTHRQARLTPSPRLGARYRELIRSSDLTDAEKVNANDALDAVIQDVRDGTLHSFRMKIRGIHAPAYGGQDGGRKMHIERDGFTIIRISGKSMKKDVIESPVETLKGNGHPAIYPESVIRRFIRMLTPRGGNVLDHYVGSGTTLVAAAKEGRNGVGIDVNAEYCDSAAERVRQIAATSRGGASTPRAAGLPHRPHTRRSSNPSLQRT